MNRLTFLNQPLFDEHVSTDACFVGFGFNSSYPSQGVELAPLAIRRVSNRYSNSDGSAQPLKIYNPDKGYLFEGVTFSDFGDIKFSRKNLPEKTVRCALEKIVSTGAFPFVFGGDHYISFLVAASFDTDFTVVQLDAHGDYLDDSSCLHGSAMRYISKLPRVKRVIHCGLRGNLNTGPGLADSLAFGNLVVTSRQLRNRGPIALTENLQFGERVYLTVDTDFFDPSICFATGFPEPAGIDYLSALSLLEALNKKTRIIGMDVVEYNPLLDHNNITGLHLTNLLLDFLSSKFKSSRRRVR